jgi:hypothetical protein
MKAVLLEHSKPAAACLVGGSPRLRIAEAHDVQATDVDEGARRRQGGCRGVGKVAAAAPAALRAARTNDGMRGGARPSSEASEAASSALVGLSAAPTTPRSLRASPTKPPSAKP